MREISVLDIEGVKIGNAEDLKGGTGVTAIIFPDGAPCGVDIRGGGPASRETHLLNPLSACERIHAVVLSGGSAFGLDSAGGVMQFLEEKGIGFDTGDTKVPLVCTSCIYDLRLGDINCRPDKAMGYAAAEAAFKKIFSTGSVGCGTGATIGKAKGADFMMKSGLGAYAIETEELKIGAVVAVNAFGDIYEDGKIIAGMLNDQKDGFASSFDELVRSIAPKGNLFTSNTTIGAVVTNAKFDKAQMGKIAAMASNALPEVIKPVNTTADGDSIYAASTGDVKADINIVGVLAAEVLKKAILNGVKEATSLCGLKCFKDFSEE